LSKIKDFFVEHQDKFILTIGGILIAVISFGAGSLTVVKSDVPITIESNSKDETHSADDGEKASNNIDSTLFGKYLASIEGNQYFAASAAKLAEIGEDKVIWFDSKEDAEEQGYTSNSNSKETDLTDEVDDVNAPSGKFVASKSGTKYYLPTCSGVKRIKEENKVYFDSIEEAEAEGLEPAKNCPGLSE